MPLSCAMPPQRRDAACRCFVCVLAGWVSCAAFSRIRYKKQIAYLRIPEVGRGTLSSKRNVSTQNRALSLRRIELQCSAQAHGTGTQTHQPGTGAACGGVEAATVVAYFHLEIFTVAAYGDIHLRGAAMFAYIGQCFLK